MPRTTRQLDSGEGTWTPVLTFATAGDLAVTYSEQVGTYVRVGNLVIATCNIATSAFTFTTASGALQVTGLPLTSKNVTSDNHIGGFVWAGITKASYTQICALLVPNSTTVIFTASGSGVAATGVTAADMPTGGTVRLRFTLAYQV